MRVSALSFIALAALGPGEPREVWPQVLPVSEKALLTVEWRSDGKRLACFGEDNTLYVLDAASGKRVQRRRFRRPVGLVRWRPDWKRLAARRQDGQVQVWDVSRWKVVRTLRRRMLAGRVWNAEGMDWSPNGQRLAVLENGDYRPGEYDVKTGRYKVYTSRRDVVRIYDVATGKQKVLLRHRRVVGPVQGHGYFRSGVSWRPDGRRVATYLNSSQNWSSPLQIWDAATGRRLRQLGGRPEGAPSAPAWRPDGARLAAVWQDMTIWNPDTGKVARILSLPDGSSASAHWSPEALAWSPDGRYVAARTLNDFYGDASDNIRPIRLWEVATGRPVALLRQEGAFLEGPFWNPDGTCLAAAASDGTVRIWDLRFLSRSRPKSASAAPRTVPLSLTRAGERLYLQHGRARLLLEGREEKVVPRPGGWQLILTPERGDEDRSVRVLRNGLLVARLSLEGLRDEWLTKDALWGPGKAGNNMRYMHQSAGGIGGFLDEAHPTSAGWVGVLNWRFFGPSGRPVRVRHLVRIPAAADSTVEPVRVLDGGDSNPSTNPAPRLFSYAGRLLLWEAGEVIEIGSKGERRRRFMKLPDQAEPHALIGSRWLVRWKQDDRRGTRIDAVDLRRKTIRPLLDEPPGRGLRTGIRNTDNATQTLLLETSGRARSFSLLSVTTGNRRVIAAPWAERVYHLWHGYLIAHETRGYAVYDARTLKLVKRLPRPREAPPSSQQRPELDPDLVISPRGGRLRSPEP